VAKMDYEKARAAQRAKRRDLSGPPPTLGGRDPVTPPSGPLFAGQGTRHRPANAMSAGDAIERVRETQRDRYKKPN
jgi:hypothetical protein